MERAGGRRRVAAAPDLDRAAHRALRSVERAIGPKTRAAAESAAPKTLPPAPPPGFAAAFLACARRDLAIGVREVGENDGPRVREYLAAVGVGAPANWCAAAITFWMRAAARELGVEPPVRGSAGAKALMAQFQQAGRFASAEELRRNPGLLQPGMVAFWHRGAPGAWTGHTAVVATPGSVLHGRLALGPPTPPPNS